MPIVNEAVCRRLDLCLSGGSPAAERLRSSEVTDTGWFSSRGRHGVFALNQLLGQSVLLTPLWATELGRKA
jgi:hypothetical protein